MLFLGIDGGGTKTEFALCDENAQVLARQKCESISHWQVSPKEIKVKLVYEVDKLLSTANKSLEDLTSIGFGMSGLGEDLEKDRMSIDLCRDVFQEIPVSFKNDGEIGLLASFGLEPGINIVAGTGSIAFGKNKEGQIARCGGWGHEIGDEGSGYWLGLKLLELFTKQADGRLEKTYIYSKLKEELGIKVDFDIMTIVQENYYGNRTKIAALQLVLRDAAYNGDQYAIDLYQLAAIELVELAKAIKRKPEFSDISNVSISGSIFKVGELILEPFEKGLEEIGLQCSKPRFETINGALILAAENVGYHRDLLNKMG